MLDTLLLAEANGNQIDLNGIEEEVNTFIFAGSDTTSTCIMFTLLLLANHQNVQDRCYDEVKDTIGIYNISTYL